MPSKATGGWLAVKVIFLDIDGVLNSESYVLKLEEKCCQIGHSRETPCDCFKLYRQIDRDAVTRLNRLVAVTGAKIVVSSTWRKIFDMPELCRILTEHGLVAEVIGATPDLFNDPGREPGTNLERGYEIDFWLRDHPEVDRFVILDDGSDMAMHRKCLVQTDCEDGLCDEHVELAARVLAWDGPPSPHPIEEA
jgi:hypothetical protein